MSLMKSRLRVMLGLTRYLACLLSLALGVYFVFSGLLIGSPT